MKATLCKRLPDAAQHIILELLDYRLRSGKYIKHLPRDLPIYRRILDRPVVEEIYFTPEHSPVQITENYDDAGEVYFTDDEGYSSFYRISLVVREYGGGFGRKCETYQERLEISYSYGDRSYYTVRKFQYLETHPDYWQKMYSFDLEFYD
jgi:hypothetical protein